MYAHTHMHTHVYTCARMCACTHTETDRKRKREADQLYQKHHHFMGLRFNTGSLSACNSVHNSVDSICRGADGSSWKTWIMWLVMLSLFVPKFVPSCSMRSNILMPTLVPLVPTVTKGQLQILLTFAGDALHPSVCS